MILVPENEFSHLKGVSKQPYLDIRTVPNISLCNRFSEVLWCNRSARMHSWFLVSPTFCFWVWNNKGPNVSSNNPSEQEPLHHIWPRDFWFPVFHSSLYTPLRFLHPSNSPFPSILPGSKQVWLRNHLYDFHLQIHFTVIKLSSHKDSFWNRGTRKHSSMSCSQEPLIVQTTIEMLHCDILNFGGNIAAVFTLTIANCTLIGHYLHYVNSSPWTENNTVSFLRKRNKTKLAVARS